MSLISHFPETSIVEFLRRSNYWAKTNRNAYPMKIYRAVSELYEWVDCPCDDDCNCKKYHCENHLVRKPGVSFNKCYEHFLKCYVDIRIHDAVREGRDSGRAKNAVIASVKIRSCWTNISGVSSKHHLLCSDWCHPLHKAMAKEFRPGPKTIYQAKWLSLLGFDSFTAYDNASVALFKRDFNKPPSYYEMMKRIRRDIMTHLDNTDGTLQDFRKYDNPSEFYNQIPRDSPKPIGNIIDKIYLTL
jgi:hypothetical protein